MKVCVFLKSFSLKNIRQTLVNFPDGQVKMKVQNVSENCLPKFLLLSVIAFWWGGGGEK